MSITKSIKIVILALGLMFTLNACVVAPGHRAPHVYAGVHWYYYPDYELYYHPIDHYYYYYSRGAWVRALTLPWRIVLSDQRRVRIEISGLPYLKHSHHIRAYPPRRANHRDRRDRREDWRERYDRDDDRRDNRDNGRRHRPDHSEVEKPYLQKPHLKSKPGKSKKSVTVIKQRTTVVRERDDDRADRGKENRANREERAERSRTKVVREKHVYKERSNNGRKWSDVQDDDDDRYDNNRKRRDYQHRKAYR